MGERGSPKPLLGTATFTPAVYGTWLIEAGDMGACSRMSQENI